MKPLRIYRVSNHYVRFLSGVDPNVAYNKDSRRPYVGIVFSWGAHNYFVPMESPKPNHANLKPGPHLMFIDGGRLGLLGFNNMIPIPDSALIQVDINSEPDQKYAALLRRQASYINRHKADVLDHAQRTYYAVTTGRNKFLMGISCDFKKLERASKKYDPAYRPKSKVKPKA